MPISAQKLIFKQKMKLLLKCTLSQIQNCLKKLFLNALFQLMISKPCKGLNVSGSRLFEKNNGYVVLEYTTGGGLLIIPMEG